MTKQQQNGVIKLLRMLDQASTKLANSQHQTNRPSWLIPERHSQLAFVDGKRGTGKTTLMSTLIQAIVPGVTDPFLSAGLLPEGDENLQTARRLANQLRGKIVPLEPIDMEPLPKETPILAAILARLQQAANEWGKRSFDYERSNWNDEPEYIQFEQFQSAIARSLESNLNSRKGNLDREQFGQAVMEQEADRLLIRSRLEEVLRQLSKSLADRDNSTPGIGKNINHLFLVIVDDVDLNPVRCLELLRILRAYSPPQLFFLLLGQYELVESIVQMQIASEFAAVHSNHSQITSVDDSHLRQQLAEVSLANLQKMVPQVVELRELELSQIMDFQPSDLEGTEAKSLGDLLQEIEIVCDAQSLFGPLKKNLRQLIEVGGESYSTLSSADSFSLGQYVGLGAFQITPRRLLQLYYRIEEAVRTNPKDIQSRGEAILRIFIDHWKYVVSEDPTLTADMRRALIEDPFGSCEFIGFGLPRKLTYIEAKLPIRKRNQTSKPEESSSEIQALVRICDDKPQSGIPRIQVRSRPSQSSTSDNTDISVQEIGSARTRCAFALLHDLHVAFREDFKPTLLSEKSNPHCMVETVWKYDSESRSLPWPIPHVQTFSKLSQFVSEAKMIRSNIHSSSRMDPQASLPSYALANMIVTWTDIGLNFLEANSPDLIRRKSKSDVNTNRSPSVQKWLQATSLLCTPEYGGLELGGATMDDINILEATSLLERFSVPDINELQILSKRRGEIIKSFANSSLAPLAQHFYPAVTSSSWLPIVVNPPISDSNVSVQSSIEDLRREISSKLNESQLDIIVSQVEIFRSTAPQTSLAYLETAIRLSDQLVASNPNDPHRVRQNIELKLQFAKDHEQHGEKLKGLVLAEDAVSRVRHEQNRVGQNPDLNFLLLQALETLSNLLVANSQYDEAIKTLDDLIELTPMHDGTDVDSSKFIRFSSSRIICLFYLKRFSEIEQYTLKLVEVLHGADLTLTLVQKESVNFVIEYVQGISYLISYSKLQGTLPENLFRFAIDLFLAFPSDASTSSYSLNQLADCAFRLSQLRNSNGDRRVQIELLECSRDFYRELVNRNTTHASNTESLLNVLNVLCNSLQGDQNRKRLREVALEHLALSYQIANIDKTNPERKRSVASSFFRVVELQEIQENREQLREILEQFLRFARTARETDPDISYWGGVIQKTKKLQRAANPSKKRRNNDEQSSSG